MGKSKSYEAYNQVSDPSCGARESEGKDSANCEDTLRKGSMPPASKVRQAKADAGKALECVKKQITSDGNVNSDPHRRIFEGDQKKHDL
jgi:hypothetical protein